MSKYIIVKVIVEGQTEQKFISEVLAPYLVNKGIFITPIVASKKGQKGGDIKFQRVKKDIGNYLAQPNVNIVSTFVDYYGVKEWPGQNDILTNSTPEQMAEIMNTAAKSEICREYDHFNPTQRFIPFIAVHEFETLLFSDTTALAEGLGISQETIEATVNEFPSLEYINNSRETAPSKRLIAWYSQYGKTTTGIAIAKKIPIDTMRTKCPLFNQWLTKLESFVEDKK